MTTKETQEPHPVDALGDDAVDILINTKASPTDDFGRIVSVVILETIDHLASKYDFVPKGGYLRAPLPRVDGLEDELEIYNIPDDQTFEGSAILKAARAYLKASEV